MVLIHLDKHNLEVHYRYVLDVTRQFAKVQMWLQKYEIRILKSAEFVDCGESLTRKS
jgi:hypothetical protein